MTSPGKARTPLAGGPARARMEDASAPVEELAEEPAPVPASAHHGLTRAGR